MINIKKIKTKSESRGGKQAVRICLFWFFFSTNLLHIEIETRLLFPRRGETLGETHTHTHTGVIVPGKWHLCSPLDGDSLDLCGPFYIWWSAAGKELEPGVTFERKH